MSLGAQKFFNSGKIVFLSVTPVVVTWRDYYWSNGLSIIRLENIFLNTVSFPGFFIDDAVVLETPLKSEGRSKSVALYVHI